jgi:hypothetical protein
VRCVTLMANRSDRRFPTLSPAMAREAARLIGNEARGNPIKARLHLNKQAGYMTATEFQIASAITLARGRGPIWLAERGDLNPRNPSEFTRSPGVRLKPVSATSPRAGASMPFAPARLPPASPAACWRVRARFVRAGAWSILPATRSCHAERDTNFARVRYGNV